VIGLDFPVKPEWIHDVLALWQPRQPIGALVDAALASAMPELGGEKTRRNSLSIILRCFVPTEGAARVRHTRAANVWAAYRSVYDVQTLAPAYLAQLIEQSEVAQEAAAFLLRRGAGGASVTSGELRRHFLGRYGERKVVLNSASAFFTTLQAFGAVTPAGKKGSYRLVEPLAVAPEVFPLIVWAWWTAHDAPQIDLERFAGAPWAGFLRVQEFPALWCRGQPNLWVLDERLEGRRATLRNPNERAFEESLLRLLPGR
jgi:hypothetical protein